MSTDRFMRRSCAIATAILALASGWPAFAQVGVYTLGHGDVGVGYVSGNFTPHWHLGGDAVVDGDPLGGFGGEFDPIDILAQTSTTRLASSLTGITTLLGVSGTTPFWVMGDHYISTTPSLGFGFEELDPADWVGGNITVSLTGFSGPGQFALYETGANTTVDARVFSTLDGDPNEFLWDLNSPGHPHFQWAFSELGDYELTFTWNGTHNLDGAISTSGTFTISAVPEPSTVAMLGVVGGIALIATVRRRYQITRRRCDSPSPTRQACRSSPR